MAKEEGINITTIYSLKSYIPWRRSIEIGASLCYIVLAVLLGVPWRVFQRLVLADPAPAWDSYPNRTFWHVACPLKLKYCHKI